MVSVFKRSSFRSVFSKVSPNEFNNTYSLVEHAVVDREGSFQNILSHAYLERSLIWAQVDLVSEK